MTAEIPEVCPHCGATGRPIIYGHPDVSMFESSDRGEIEIGGCVVDDDSPAFRCANGHAFGEGAYFPGRAADATEETPVKRPLRAEKRAKKPAAKAKKRATK
jgi:hypothetical protein